jgi:hypothetical protein
LDFTFINLHNATSFDLTAEGFVDMIELQLGGHVDGHAQNVVHTQGQVHVEEDVL